MWLPRPLYESLPYAYAGLGVAGIAASWLVRVAAVSIPLLIAGALSLILGIMIWLRRKDFRGQWSQYNSRSLDDIEQA